MGVGQWSLDIADSTPGVVREKIDVRASGFGHIVILPGHIRHQDVTDADMLRLARYVGVYRSQSASSISGAGLNSWLGDEDGKGLVLAGAYTATTWLTWVNLLRPSFLGAGVSPASGGASFTRVYNRTTLRPTLDEVCSFFGGEWRVTNEFKLDVGTRAQLYRTSPIAMIVRRRGDSGRDPNVTGIEGELDLSRDVEDWVRSVLYYYNNNASVYTASGGVAAVNVPYRYPDGSAAEIRRVVQDSTTSASEATALGNAEYTKYRYARQELRLSSDLYDIGDDIQVGDPVWVFDDEMGIANTANQVTYRGQTVYPEVIRCVGYTWPVRNGMGVYFRRHVWNGAAWVVEWTDLTEYIEWETGATTIEVSSGPRPLTK